MARVVPKISYSVIDGPICTSRIRTAAIEFKLTHSSDLSEGRRTHQSVSVDTNSSRAVGINRNRRNDARRRLIPDTLDYEPYMPNISFESYQRSRISQRDPDVTNGPMPRAPKPCVRQSFTTCPRGKIFQSKAMKSLPP